MALAAAVVLTGVATARPLTPAEGRQWGYSGIMPLCADEAVLNRIQSRFTQRETTYWKSGLTIDGFRDVRQTGLRTAGVDLIPKRYCKARAVMNDGRVRQVAYWIGEDLGMTGWGWGLGRNVGWGVEWCVAGLDHHRAFGPACSAAGP